MDYFHEIPKHRKRAKKKNSKKTDHKHKYKDIIGKYTDSDGNIHIFPAKRCSICGKVVRKQLFFTMDVEYNGINFKQIIFTEDKIKELYPELLVVEFKKEIF